MSRNGKGSVDRQGSVFRQDSEPEWFREYASNLQKSSVKSVQEDSSIFDQVQAITGTRARFHSVEEAVRDMQNRSGLARYLQMSAGEKETVKRAAREETGPSENFEEEPQQWPESLDSYDNTDSDLEVSLDGSEDHDLPKIIENHPNIAAVVRNYVESRKGNVHVQAVMEKIHTLFRHEGISSDELEDKNFKDYINDIIIKEKKQHDNNEDSIDIELGKSDTGFENDTGDSNDAFSILMPAKL